MEKKETQKAEPSMLKNLTGGKIEMREIEEVLERKVTKYGTSSHIPVPSKHLNKEAQVIIWKEEKEEDQKN